MQTRLTTIVAALVVHAIASFSLGDASFQTLGDLPGGYHLSTALNVSSDGSTIVGHGSTGFFQQGGPTGVEPFRWTQESGMVSLGGLQGRPDGWALGVSSDGAAIVGRSRLGNEPSRAFRWTEAYGMADLGTMLDDPDAHSVAADVSGDGSVVVGCGSSPEGEAAFRWTASTGMVSLGDLPGGGFYSRATGISDDGSAIVGVGTVGGVSSTSAKYTAFRWTAGDGMVALGDLPGGKTFSSATAVSGDGSTVIGYGYSGTGPEFGEGFRWAEQEGMVSLGTYAGDASSIVPEATSHDGSVIVGYATIGESGIMEAFIWDTESGYRNLKNVLIDDYGLDVLEQWQQLAGAYGVSADGQTVVGFGINPDGDTEAWVARLPEPCTLMLLAVGALAMARRRTSGTEEEESW
ncbi:MAG: PEP-CTERM sorting domain-containing protein [bacterium]|nr:PEP-CTERM sorting domain-containing protein [bacterium]